MKTCFKSLILIGCASLVVGAVASSSDETQIRALYAKTAKSMKALDVKGVEAGEAPDFTSTEGGHTLNLAQSNQMMENQFKMIKSIKKLSIKITSLKVSGKTAHVTTSYSFEAMIGPIQQGDTKNHTLAASGQTSDVLEKTSKGWLFKSEKQTTSKSMMDGKAMKGAGM